MIQWWSLSFDTLYQFGKQTGFQIVKSILVLKIYREKKHFRNLEFKNVRCIISNLYIYLNYYFPVKLFILI